MDRVSRHEHLKCYVFLLRMNFLKLFLITLNFSCKLWPCYCSLLNQTANKCISLFCGIHLCARYSTNQCEWMLSSVFLIPASPNERKYSCAPYFACKYEWIWGNYVRKLDITSERSMKNKIRNQWTFQMVQYKRFNMNNEKIHITHYKSLICTIYIEILSP